MKTFLFIANEIRKGKSLTRAYLNLRLTEETLSGKTIDIGGGWNSDYISFMKKEKDVDFVNFDIKNGVSINFETDRLPSEDGSYDTVLFLNVMEHVFNYQHITNEVVRITKPGGQIIGFVPFLMWYHPDHQDYFRYTHEALEKIFLNSGLEHINIEVIGVSPFGAGLQMVLLSFPKFIRVPVFALHKLLDKMYTLVKGDKARVYELGYYFKVMR